jgi:GNAT superfamily N-acetyltransferase
MQINEIERLQSTDYTGGKSYLRPYSAGQTAQPLPGGSGFLYSIEESKYGGVSIKIWDPASPNTINPLQKPIRFPENTYAERLKQWKLATGRLAPGKIIGRLLIQKHKDFPVPGAVLVDTITVDEDYRNKGIAKALYGIVLSIMKLPLVAGTSQTPAGARNWVSLSNIPGVDVKGYVIIPEDMFEDKTIDTLMGKLGAEYIGKDDHEGYFFSFDVSANNKGTELVELVKTALNKIYVDWQPRDTAPPTTGLYAIWTGQ